MSDPLKTRLKQLIVTTLKLEDVTPTDLADDEPLIGSGLNLDSIDALELIVLLQQQYQIKLSNAEEGPKVFKSVRSMAEYITTHQKK